MTDPFTVVRITTFADRAEAVVDCPEPVRTAGWPGLADAALQLLPGLVEHDCRNDVGAPFITELGDTELAHLFEHVAIELRLLAGAHRRLSGETTWNFKRDGQRRFRVRMETRGDGRAWVEAFKGAEAVLQWLTAGSPHDAEAAGGEPNVDAIVAKVRAAAR